MEDAQGAIYTTSILFIYFFLFLFLITRTLEHEVLAAAFSTTSLTEFKQNHLSGLVEIDLSLYVEIPEFSLFKYSFR